MTSCVILDESNNSSGINRMCFALVGCHCVSHRFDMYSFIDKGRDILIVSRREFEM